MLVKLHDRPIRGSGSRTGLSCDSDGVAFGDHVLIERSGGGALFRRRPIAEINRALSKAYGLELDLTSRAKVLDGIAEQLNKGDLGRAQLLALQLRLPDPAALGVEPLLKAARLLRFNPNHDEKGRFTFAAGGAAGGTQHATPGGAKFSTKARLNADQMKVASKIIDYGLAHKIPKDQIALAVNHAFNESAFGQQETNPKSSARGLFQYLEGSWSFLKHDDLDRFSDDDQIVAMVADIAHYQQRYNAGQAKGTVPKSVSFSDYVALRHNLGPYSVEWGSDKVDHYNASARTLGFEF